MTESQLFIRTHDHQEIPVPTAIISQVGFFRRHHMSDQTQCLSLQHGSCSHLAITRIFNYLQIQQELGFDEVSTTICHEKYSDEADLDTFLAAKYLEICELRRFCCNLKLGQILIHSVCKMNVNAVISLLEVQANVNFQKIHLCIWRQTRAVLIRLLTF